MCSCCLTLTKIFTQNFKKRINVKAQIWSFEVLVSQGQTIPFKQTGHGIIVALHSVKLKKL